MPVKGGVPSPEGRILWGGRAGQGRAEERAPMLRRQAILPVCVVVEWAAVAPSATIG